MREFTRRSRTRLQQTLCAIPKDQVIRGMLFITLTYPGKWSRDARIWKRDLDSFGKRFRRALPEAAFVWKLEPQPRRSAPHYHLIVTGVRFIAKEWLSRVWYEVVGSKDPKHLAAGTQVQIVQSHRGVISYAAKYTAKHQELPADWQEPGRWWGVIGRENLGIEWVWAGLSEYQYFAARRILRAIIRTRSHRSAHRPTGPPRSVAWAVLPDWQAQRIAICVGRMHRTGPPTRCHERTYPRSEGVDFHFLRPLGDLRVEVSAHVAVFPPSRSVLEGKQQVGQRPDQST